MSYFVLVSDCDRIVYKNERLKCSLLLVIPTTLTHVHKVIIYFLVRTKHLFSLQKCSWKIGDFVASIGHDFDFPIKDIAKGFFSSLKVLLA